jgi:hypothetical protein
VSVRVDEVDAVEEREAIVSALERNLGELDHARRFNWLYRDNPAHRAWSWLVRETSSGRVVGMASLFPRFMWVGAKTALCGQVGDFAVDADYRTLGPATLLQRATFGPVDRGLLALCYDCPPDARGMATFRRLGMSPRTRMQRYARLLRVDRQVARRLGGGTPVASAATSLGNAVLRYRRTGRRALEGMELSRHRGRFDEEFSWLDQRGGGGEIVRGRRATEDLNWRYREDPLRRYETIVARRGGELVGFAVFFVSGEDAHVAELCADAPVEVGASLLESVVEALAAEPVQTVQLVLASDHPMTEAARRAGFRFRAPSASVVAYARADSAAQGVLDAGARWLFSHADVMA